MSARLAMEAISIIRPLANVKLSIVFASLSINQANV
jgi:hypothetical protein